MKLVSQSRLYPDEMPDNTVQEQYRVGCLEKAARGLFGCLNDSLDCIAPVLNHFGSFPWTQLHAFRNEALNENHSLRLPPPPLPA